MAKLTFATRTLGKSRTFKPATLAGHVATVIVVTGCVAELQIYTAGMIEGQAGC